ncbi:MAG: hypothetical protein JSR37_01835 [Verrucomicrobia bacterium]|nr:hypothetical protein [Verrucomicrobiota bacterium]MBS0635980.1 hypothetical protein [Verrucomicrobiota bacterium]
MSVSGYVAEGYSLRVYNETNQKTEHKHSEIVQKVAISASGSEIRVPCIVKKRRYELQFEIRRQPLSDVIPACLQPEQISLEFYRSKSFATKANKLEVSMRESQPILITDDTITGSYSFKTPDDFHSTKETEFIYIALKVHDHLIKYIASDIAVFTHTAQISHKYDLVLADHAKSHIQDLFWFDKASFISKEESRQLKEEKMLAKEEEVDADKKPLLAIIRATETGLKKMRELLKSDNSDYSNQLTDIFQSITGAYSQNVAPLEHFSNSETTPVPPPELPMFPLSLPYSLDWDLDY